MSERTQGERDLMATLNQGHDGDEWGLCMSWFFAVAHTLYHLDEVPAEWQYSHGLCDGDMRDPDEFEESEIAYLMVENLVTVEDLINFGHFLDHWSDELREAGKDY